MDLHKSYLVNQRIAKAVFVAVLLVAIGFGLYTFVMRAGKFVSDQYVPTNFR